MFGSLINPNLPRAAVGLRGENVSVVGLQKQGRGFQVRRAATIELKENALQPDFFERNVYDTVELLTVLRETAAGAGLQSNKKWSVSLPADAARMAILTLEVAPKSKAETTEVLNWKAERAFGAKVDEMRIAFQPLTPDISKRPRYFAVAIRLTVLDEYEMLFDNLGWQAGLILPRHVSEANWLMLPKNKQTSGDALLLSSQVGGFTAVLFRQSEPSIVRSIACRIDERDDELYRLLLFYRDRAEAENSESNLRRMLLIGEGFDLNIIRDISQETLGHDLQILGAPEIGLNIPAEIDFADIAAPAGLASLAWR